MVKAKTVQRSGQGRRRKGDLHSPKGEAKVHSANTELKRSVPLHPGDLGSSAEPKRPKSLGSKELDEARDWLIAELSSMGVAKPVVFRGRKGHGVEVKDGRRKLGGIDNADLITRNVHAVEDLFRLHGSVTIEIDPKAAHAHKDILFGVCRALVAGQRAVMRALYRGEHDTPAARDPDFVAYCALSKNKVDQLIAKGGTLLSNSYAYPILRYAASQWLANSKTEVERNLSVASNQIGSASKNAERKWRDWMGHQDEQSLPRFTTPSCEVDADQYKLTMKGRELSVALKIQGADGGRIPVIDLDAYARGGSGWADLRRILSGEWERRSARLVWDDARRRWLLKISVMKPRPELKHGVGAMVVCPGVDSLVRVWGSNGWRGPADDTASIIARKLRIDSRKSQLGQHKDFQGHGARGHGRGRFTKLLRRFGDAEARFDKTHIQQGAARVVQLALGQRLGKNGWSEREGSVGEVLVNSFGSFCPTHPDRRIERVLRRFPICAQRDAICWALRKAGIPHRVVKSANLCPACGEAKVVHYSGMDWCCPKCHLRAPRDLWTAWQTFIAGGDSQHYDLSEVGKEFREAAEYAESIRRKAEQNGSEETEEAAQ